MDLSAISITKSPYTENACLAIPLPEDGVSRLRGVLECNLIDGFGVSVDDGEDDVWVRGSGYSRDGRWYGFSACAENGLLYIETGAEYVDPLDYTNDAFAEDKQWPDFVQPLRALVSVFNQ